MTFRTHSDWRILSSHPDPELTSDKGSQQFQGLGFVDSCGVTVIHPLALRALVLPACRTYPLQHPSSSASWLILASTQSSKFQISHLHHQLIVPGLHNKQVWCGLFLWACTCETRNTPSTYADGGGRTSAGSWYRCAHTERRRGGSGFQATENPAGKTARDAAQGTVPCGGPVFPLLRVFSPFLCQTSLSPSLSVRSLSCCCDVYRIPEWYRASCSCTGKSFWGLCCLCPRLLLGCRVMHGAKSGPASQEKLSVSSFGPLPGVWC